MDLWLQLGSGDLGSISGTVSFLWVSPAVSEGHSQLSLFLENTSKKWSAAIPEAAQIASLPQAGESGRGSWKVKGCSLYCLEAPAAK